MGQNTKIQWAHHTFNPWRGCTKVAEGCRNCYADAQSKRNPGTLGIWGPNGTRVVAAESAWKEPLKWNRQSSCGSPHCKDRVLYRTGIGGAHGGCPVACPECEKIRPRVFCASLADVFEDWDGPMSHSSGRVMLTAYGSGAKPMWGAEGDLAGVDQDWADLTMRDVRRRLFELIDATPNLDWLLVTKRPENILRMWPKRFTCEDCYSNQVFHGEGPACGCHCNDCGSVTATERRQNTWLLTSIACQEDADRNIADLLKCRDLVPVLGVSAEPLIGPVDFNADGGWLVPWDEFCGPDQWNERFVCDGGHSARAYLKSEGEGRNICLAPNCHADVHPAKPGIDWVIVGGESGPNARPCNIEWIYSIVEQCRTAGVACFVKQLGAKPVNYLGEQLVFDDKKGGDFEVFPSSLRVRQFPEVVR